MKEPKPMREIHKIREKIYAENKRLSHKQRLEKTKRIAKDLITQYRLNIHQIDKAA